MSLDHNTLIKLIKKAALDAVMANKPMAMCLGEVVSVDPLKISVDQKMTLTTAQLVLTNAVRDHTVDMTLDLATDSALSGVTQSHKHSFTLVISEEEKYSGYTEESSSNTLAHSHSISGSAKCTLRNGLKMGEKVILLRCDGGQKFIVLDRMEGSA